MNNFQDILDKYKLKPYKYKYINEACIIYTDNGNYVIKKKIKNNKDEIYDYLLSRDFISFLYPENSSNDEYEIYSYIDEVNIDKNLKAKDLIYIISDLHNRTTSYKKIDLDEIKEIYEEKQEKIKYLENYYNDLEEVFILHVYNSPSEYLLLRNIDKIYNTLNYSKILLDRWYSIITNNPTVRLTMNHNHLSLDHFIDNHDAKLINFDYAKLDYPINDIAYFYKQHYLDLDMESLYSIYKHKFKCNLEEELMLFIEIMLPWKIFFTDNNLDNTIKVYKLNKYLVVTREFILKQEKKDKKTDNSEENK